MKRASFGLRLLRRPVFLAALAAGASLATHACGGRGGPGATAPGGASPSGSPGSGPACVDQLPLEDCVDYAIEREAVVALLADLEQARDVRSVPVAETALDSGDPVVVSAGLRLLGPFADQNEAAAARAVPLLTSPYLTTQRLAAAVLERSPKHAPLANQYRTGHGSEPELHPWAKAPALDVTKMGFPPPYPGASPFAPGDSPLSAGLATTDAADTVIAHYRSALGRQPVAWSAFEPTLTAQTVQNYEELAKQIQALQAEYMKTQDPALLKKMQELAQGAQQSASTSLQRAPFPSPPTSAGAQVFVAEQEGTTPIRAVVVYPEPLLGRTVVLYAWSAPKYPPLPRTPEPPKSADAP